MCIAQGMTLLDVTIVNTALPSIQRELHMTAGQLEWVISAYALSLAAFIPLGGALGDRFGRKRFFLVGMVVFTLGLGGLRPLHLRRGAHRVPRACRERVARSCRP